MVTEITTENIKDIMNVQDDAVRFIMFYGVNCGACKSTMPGYEFVARFYTQKNSPCLFYKINAWEPEEQKQFITETFGSFGVPHFKVMWSGQPIIEKSAGMDLAKMFQFSQNCIDEAYRLIHKRNQEVKQ